MKYLLKSSRTNKLLDSKGFKDVEDCLLEVDKKISYYKAKRNKPKYREIIQEWCNAKFVEDNSFEQQFFGIWSCFKEDCHKGYSRVSRIIDNYDSATISRGVDKTLESLNNRSYGR